jgi:hypothetical protein
MFLATSSFGQWSKKNIADEFGDPTDEVCLLQTCTGTFSNSATIDSELTVDLVIYYSKPPDNWLWLRFDLYPYNQKSSVRRNQFGKLSVKTASGLVSECKIWHGLQIKLFSNTRYGKFSGDKNLSSDDLDGRNLLFKLKNETEPMKFHILLEDGATYNFKVDPKGFDELLLTLNGPATSM